MNYLNYTQSINLNWNSNVTTLFKLTVYMYKSKKQTAFNIFVVVLHLIKDKKNKKTSTVNSCYLKVQGFFCFELTVAQW